MTDSKPPEDADAGESGDAREAEADSDDVPAHAGEPDEDENIDLDDLDELGVDGVVDRMGGVAKPTTARRPAWLSGLVMLASIGLLVWLWPDFRFWLQPADPVQIGAASEWMQDGRVPPGWTNAHVGIDGTPNVRWAMLRGDADGERKSFFDLVEAQGQLFVITGQVSDQHQTRRYAGHFEGRLMRLGDDQLAMTRMAQLYAQENVTRAADITPAALAETRGRDELVFETVSEGSIELAPEDRVRFVVESVDARVMMGGLSFRTGEDAEAAIVALGYPYFRLPDLEPPADPRKALGTHSGEPLPPGRSDAYRFVVRIPDAERKSAHAALESKMIGEADPTDHRKGVSLFSRPATYFAPAGAVRIEGDTVVFPHDENDPAPGYEVKDGKLVERRLGDGLMRVRLDALTELRLELPIVVDPDGYLLVDGYHPAHVWQWGVAFLGVLAITALNGMWLLLGMLRRRR